MENISSVDLDFPYSQYDLLLIQDQLCCAFYFLIFEPADCIPVRYLHENNLTLDEEPVIAETKFPDTYNTLAIEWNYRKW